MTSPFDGPELARKLRTWAQCVLLGAIQLPNPADRALCEQTAREMEAAARAIEAETALIAQQQASTRVAVAQLRSSLA